MSKLRIFEALIDEYALDDIGMSGLTIEVQALKKGKCYPQCSVNKQYFRDDNGCLRDIETLLEARKIKETTFD